jgi:hypothetical protein
MADIAKDYHGDLLKTIREVARGERWWSSPLNLGGIPGPSGGSGGPVGGLFGQLPQTRVAYDTSEAAYSGIYSNPPSGSLLDNLAHMRFRLEDLEALIGKVTVLDDGETKGQPPNLDFMTGLSVTVIGSTAYIYNTITPAGGHYLRYIEDLSSQVPSSGNHFDTSYTVISGSLKLSIDGLMQAPSSYTTDLDGGGFTVLFDVPSGTLLYADYSIVSGSLPQIRVHKVGILEATGVTVLDFDSPFKLTINPPGTPESETGIGISISGIRPSVKSGEDLYQEIQQFEYVGSGVSVSNDGGKVVITIPGYTPGIPSVDIYRSGIFQGSATELDFTGAVGVTVISDRATIDIGTAAGSGAGVSYSGIIVSNGPFIRSNIVKHLDFGNYLDVTLVEDDEKAEINLTTGEIWSTDNPPLVETSYDDEFNGTSLDPKWTEFDPSSILTVSVERWGLDLNPLTSPAEKAAGIYQSHDNSDITIITKVGALSKQSDDLKIGILLANDIESNPTTSPLAAWTLYMGGAGTGLQYVVYSDYQTLSGASINETAALWLTDVYLRVRISGADIGFDFSSDGVGWITKGTYTKPFDIGQIGIFIINNTSFETKAVSRFFRTRPYTNLNQILEGSELTLLQAD